jgi:hypothetical protein
MQEGLTWLFVGLTVAAYLAERRAAAERQLPVTATLNAQLEVDPTRWRHNGSQPNHYGTFDGNRRHKRDAAVLNLQNVLAF